MDTKSEEETSLRKAFQAELTHSLQVRPLVFGSVAGVAEGLVAARVLAQVGLLPCVAAQVDLQILQPGEGLLAALKLKSSCQRKPTTSSYSTKNGIFIFPYNEAFRRIFLPIFKCFVRALATATLAVPSKLAHTSDWCRETDWGRKLKINLNKGLRIKWATHLKSED